LEEFMTMRAYFILTAAVATLIGCGGGSGKPAPGQSCQYNSECQAGLTCSFGRCMSACQAEADCPVGQQCVKNSSGTNSCLLPEVETCNYTTECAPPLVCASDSKCRSQCLSDRDCATKTQKCLLPDGVCAEPSAIDPVTGGLKSPVVGLDGGAPDSRVVEAGLPDAPVVDVSVADQGIPDSRPVDIAVADLPLGAEAGGPESGNTDASITDASITDASTAEVGNCVSDASALTLPSTISSEVALTYRVGCKYKVTSSVTVKTGGTLTIEPGVEIEFASGVGLTVNGTLSAAGTADLPIRFFGAQATAGYWKGVIFSSSDNVNNLLDHVIVENAGTMNTSYSGTMAGSVVVSVSRVQIRNSIIRGGSGVGLTLYNPTLDDFAGNVITQNAQGAVYVESSEIGQLLDSPSSTFVGNTVDIVAVDGDTVSKDQTWPALDVSYLVSGTVTVTANVSVQAGAKFRMAKDATIYVSTATGSLHAQGAAGREIAFSGDQATRGYWKGVEFANSDNVNNLLEYVIIEHAGTASTSSSGDLPASLVVNATRVQIKNSIVRLGSGVGLTLRSPILDAFTGNSLTLNTQGAAYLTANYVGQLAGIPLSSVAGNEANYIVVGGGTVNAAQTWPVFDAPYLISSDVTVGAAVTLMPGSSLVFKQDCYLNVNSTGSLSAQGLAETGKQITFTGEQATPGFWGGLWFSSTRSPNNILDHVIVSYGGGHAPSSSVVFAANILVNNGQLTVTNSTISNSANYGMSWNSSGSIVTQTNNTFVGNVVDHP
jgi:hypothetical protein